MVGSVPVVGYGPAAEAGKLLWNSRGIEDSGRRQGSCGVPNDHLFRVNGLVRRGRQLVWVFRAGRAELTGRGRAWCSWQGAWVSILTCYTKVLVRTSDDGRGHMPCVRSWFGTLMAFGVWCYGWCI